MNIWCGCLLHSMRNSCHLSECEVRYRNFVSEFCVDDPCAYHACGVCDERNCPVSSVHCGLRDGYQERYPVGHLQRNAYGRAFSLEYRYGECYCPMSCVVSAAGVAWCVMRLVSRMYYHRPPFCLLDDWILTGPSCLETYSLAGV